MNFKYVQCITITSNDFHEFPMNYKDPQWTWSVFNDFETISMNFNVVLNKDEWFSKVFNEFQRIFKDFQSSWLIFNVLWWLPQDFNYFQWSMFQHGNLICASAENGWGGGLPQRSENLFRIIAMAIKYPSAWDGQYAFAWVGLSWTGLGWVGLSESVTL